MLIRLPNGDMVESSDVCRVQALEAVYIPDRVLVTLAAGEEIEIPVDDIDEALELRDEINDGIDAAGECVMDLMPEEEPICEGCGLPISECEAIGEQMAIEQLELEAEEEEMEVECPHCGETFTCEVYGEHYCPECDGLVDVVEELGEDD